jgi:hypothetical protein
MISLLDYLAMAEQYKGTRDYLGFGAVVTVVCNRYGIKVEHDLDEIIVHTDRETIAKIEF